jgi:peptidoglycan/xylan/chitin deacetylase (PgdA/CDA1 family)
MMPVAARLRYLVKAGLAGAEDATGLLGLRLRRSFRDRAVVLMYHRVLPPEDAAATWSHPGIVVGRETFARQMAALRRHFDVLSPDAFVAHLESRQPFARPSCLVTFDDGWQDNYTHAWPILRAHGIPALIFLPTAFIGTGAMFWQERLKRLLATAIDASRTDGTLRDALRQRLAAERLAQLVDVSGERVRTAVMAAVHARKDGGVDGSAALIDDVARLVAAGPAGAPSPDAFMTWAMVREMAASGIVFGAHGVTHRLMTAIGLDDVRRELAEARAVIAAEIGGAPRTVSYPNGNWNPDVAAAVRAAGYAAAFTTAEHAVSPADDTASIGRVNIHEDATAHVPLFLARLCGAA